MEKIWNKFGKEILKYYANKGTQITYIPYTSREEIYRSLFSLNYYICFVIDGTGLMSGSINTFGDCVSEIIEETLGETVYFKIVVYHGHAVSGLKCTEKIFQIIVNLQLTQIVYKTSSKELILTVAKEMD